MPDVDSLFPPKPENDLDSLFPPSVERDRNAPPSSPVQDFLFSNDGPVGTRLHNAGRVLTALGQGAKHGWGSEPLGLSKESDDALKKAGVFNDYMNGTGSILRAANETLLRPAAVVAEGTMRGLGAVMGAGQAAIAEVGAIEGYPLLGRDLAAMIEAMPAGAKQITGIPHSVHGRPAEMPVERPVEVPISGEVKPEAKPVETPAPVAVSEAGPVVEAAPAVAAEAPRATAAIADDVTAKLVAAGRPEVEARASAELVASHYESRAERFKGERGTAEELYKADGADIRPGKGAAPVKSDPIRPTPEAGAAEVPREMAQGLDLGKELNQAAYHGSPYDFEVFDTGKIGTGEGAQAYGHGLYFAENEKVAQVYRDALARPTVDGAIADAANPEHLAATFLDQYKTRDAAIKELDDAVKWSKDNPQFALPKEHIAAATQAKKILESKKPLPEVRANSGNLYKVNIKPEPHEFLQWDNPVTDKTMLDKVMAAANEIKPGWYDRLMGQGKDLAKWSLTESGVPQTGATIYGTLKRGLGSDRAASEALTKAGIPGIRYLDGGSRAAGEGSHNYVVFDPQHIEITDKNGKPVSRREFELDQIKRGKISFREDAKPIITLFKDANESTFIHETGHQWLEELIGDSKHAQAPAELKADAASVLRWLGVDSPEAIKTSHHEKFARGFERYMMEGKAPNHALASVFEKFKNWLTKIYQTVTRLKSPINDEIRGVFDRLLTMHPEKVKIEPDAPPKTFADIHEVDSVHTVPENARPVAETIRAERDMLANEHIPEEHDARLEGIASGTARREAGGSQPLRNGDEAARPEEIGNDQATGAVGAGGTEAAPESARPSIAVGKSETPAGPLEPFTGPASPFVDKAGNIRLENLGTPESINKAIRDAAAENDDFTAARRGVISDGQVIDLADALGMDAEKLQTRVLGQAFNAEQIVAARKLLIQSATSVRDAMMKAAHGSEADVLAYAKSKTQHQMIQEQVSGITAEAGRALRAFRALEGGAEAKQIGEFLKDATGKTLFQLQREAQLGMLLETPQQVSKFINDTVKPTWKDMVIEAWISALLSGLRTHEANMIGNSLVAIMRPIETTVAAGVGTVRRALTGSTEGVRFGEATAEVFGIVQGSREGVVAAWKAFKTEEPQFTSTRQTEQGHQRALPSFTMNVAGRELELGGRQARIPLRMLTAEDELFKAIAFRGNINRQAFAQAVKEGLEGDRFEARVEHLSANPTEAMLEGAKTVANYQTFQTPLGPTGRAIQQFANSHILAKIVIPFVRTPMNLLKYAFERTPLGVFAEETRANLSGKNGAAARDTQIARLTIGTMIGTAAFSLAAEGSITGGGPADPKRRALMVADGWQPYSIKIGEMYYAYNRFDPFSIIMGLVSDAYEIAKTSGTEALEKAHLPAMIFAAISKNVLNRASLQGPSDLLQAISDPERFGKGYIKGLVGTVVPTIAAQTAQTVDPVVREARTVLDGIKARIPGLSKDLMPKRDIWGEPVIREGGIGPDIAAAILERRIKDDPVNKALLSAGLYPSKLQRKINGVELTDQQYDNYQRVAGRTAKMMLNQIVKMPGFDTMPKHVRVEIMQNAVTAARAQARALTVMESVSGENNIVIKSIDLQKKKRLSPAN